MHGLRYRNLNVLLKSCIGLCIIETKWSSLYGQQQLCYYLIDSKQTLSINVPNAVDGVCCVYCLFTKGLTGALSLKLTGN